MIPPFVFSFNSMPSEQPAAKAIMFWKKEEGIVEIIIINAETHSQSGTDLHTIGILGNHHTESGWLKYVVQHSIILLISTAHCALGKVIMRQLVGQITAHQDGTWNLYN